MPIGRGCCCHALHRPNVTCSCDTLWSDTTGSGLSSFKETNLSPHRRRMVETFVEVVRRGIENRDELSVTYTVPSRSDEDGEQADRDSEDLPDLMPIRDGELSPQSGIRMVWQSVQSPTESPGSIVAVLQSHRVTVT